jgi:hypothetical protein
MRRDLYDEPDDECATDFGPTDVNQSTMPAAWSAFEELTFDVPRRASDWIQVLQRLSRCVWNRLVAIGLFCAALAITTLDTAVHGATRRR